MHSNLVVAENIVKKYESLLISISLTLGIFSLIISKTANMLHYLIGWEGVGYPRLVANHLKLLGLN